MSHRGPSVDFRKQAKSLHREASSGIAEAIERVRSYHPFFHGKNDDEISAKTTRRTAQKAIARENGFPLKTTMERE